MSTDSEDFIRGRKTLGRLLDDYKQNGCTMLMVGDVPDQTLNHASAKLLGDPAAGPRNRVFGLFDRNEQTVTDRLDRAGYSQHPTRVVETAAFARSTATTTPTSTSTESETDGGIHPSIDYSLDVTTVEERDLDAVVAELADAFDAADPDYPAELRVCIDSLRPLCDAFDADAVGAFLDNLTSEIVARRGMGHFVLPVAADRECIAQVRDHFDILVPLRTQNGTPEQRWVFTDDDRQTDWLKLRE